MEKNSNKRRAGAVLRITLVVPESIELFIEDQAFSSSYDLASHLSLHHIFPLKVVSLSQSSCVPPIGLTFRRGGGGVKLCDDEKAWSFTNRSILSGRYTLRQRHFDITMYSMRASKVHNHIQYIHRPQLSNCA